jgi:vacuolar-type H+-ATPase subunit I/STV1
MSTFLWFLFAAVYLACLVSLGMSTLRNGHRILFFVGIFFPVLWIIGALIAPAPGAAVAR